MTDLSFWTQSPPAPSQARINSARQRQDSLTKPPGSLGQLESLAIALCGQLDTEKPAVDRVQITVFAADHGVCDEQISAFPQSVTGQMIANFAAGGAAISVLSAALGAELDVVNLGSIGPLAEMPGVINHRIAAGTANLAREPAMSEAQLVAALAAGDQAAQRAADRGAQLFIGGEMGIGNTTTAAALACALLGAAPTDLTGPGTGLSKQQVTHKTAVVERALARHGDNQDPFAVLASLGGFEIAGLAGAFLGCASRGIPVLVDGFIASVAALVACRQQPALRPWLHFAHRSCEPGHSRVLDALEANPLLDLSMRLGEGSGAAVAVPLLRLACALHNGMASFAEAGVSEGS
ncbi:nicotinate-nucleotide--dimethylbenzimidazole phosphoribosyltransferase [Hydrocarboniclastica marina]|uniref:Nicotinate-nucleotide--dimethylbenzimidazole phosphoribosyltransferase n=1 Tax=Hydrocarboniclastica marina TaxID=2259620 RepID=A0A4P7XIY6_9ALTE|nr:nicotinate-nucleotide--dimethylbenzimidazole phosphoribosyltransferase [Hydrocarboniclastica marina]QCF27069.1 nicotinate-nucleotide--dimethylbenzimidazole phosphoribosyltransferase [Hydrocarboniclastica marina]